MRLGQRKGFTLVELLVVIGIIALLISILLPSLNKARSQANLVSAQSNFKQIYSALLFYANDNKGMLPIAAGTTWGVQGTNGATFTELSKYLGGPKEFDETNQNHKISSVFVSSELVDPANSMAWAPNMVRTVKWNIRAMPGIDQLTMKTPEGTLEYPQRKLASIKKGTEKIAFFEGPQILTWNMTTPPTAWNVDGWRWNWSHMWDEYRLLNTIAAWDMARANGPIEKTPNRDDASDWWVTGVRYRFSKNSATPVGFFDGHVESRKIGEIKVRELCINK